MPESIIAPGENIQVVGRLHFETEGRRQHSEFEYTEAFEHAETDKALGLEG